LARELKRDHVWREKQINSFRDLAANYLL
jgi:hypothetical protein